jgi:quinol-cytochrome oxidoreductase complex cytochrome b subunit/coenzyme F420-reducing hydrogenase delta subunit/NAD-dependent dihydropyrimidine dehydrogenase PreA subunit
MDRRAPPPKTAAARLVARVDAAFDRPFGHRANPLRHLGALGFYLFWIVLASGIYLYFAYDATATGAWRSLEALSRTPPGALARGLHRYASDAFVAVVALHLVRELLLGRFTGARWFPWVTGVVLLALVYASGIGGYWLVWDSLAQFSLTATAEWLDRLPLFGSVLARNFLDGAQMSDRFYALLLFLHIGLPLALLAGMWLHIQRIVRADVTPARALGLGTLATLAALSFALPAVSQAPADVAQAPTRIALDWWLLFVHPLMVRTSPDALWFAVAGFAAVALALPWLARAPRPPVARVSPENCNGCGRCFVDCPFGAVVIGPRTDGKRAPGQAHVLPELCVGCGICAGACPSSTPFRSAPELVTGIDLPQRPLAVLRDELERALGSSSGGPRVVVIGCDHALDVRPFARADTGTVSLLCAGQLPPSFVEYALRGGADGVLVAACARGGCRYRLGDAWTAERLAGRREPHLRPSVPRERLRVVWTVSADELARELEAFRGSLVALEARPAARPLPPRRLNDGMVAR